MTYSRSKGEYLAIIVDKELKRHNIALSCKELLLDNAIKNITVSQIAKAANIGKGTIYEYFSNKDEIVFEIITLFVKQIQKDLLAVLENNNISCKDKLKYFLSLVFVEQYSKELFVYQEFLSIALCSATSEMREFRSDCQSGFENILEKIIEQGIGSNELSKNSKVLIPTIRYFHTGLIVDSAISILDTKLEIDKFINFIFNEINFKEDK
jgi:AcrR family transcriptional regulator